MKAYRKKFILLNMTLVGAILLFVLIGINIYMYNYYSSDLKSTLKQALEPSDKTEPSHGKKTPEEKPEPSHDSDDENITTVFYSGKDKSFSLVSENSDYNEATLKEIVQEVKEQKASYGTLSKYNIIYYKNGKHSDTTKIALTPTLSIIYPMLKLIGISLLIYTLSMIVFYFISRYISGLAVKPLKDAINMEKQFVTDVSHDLKTPLTVIMVNNSILRSNSDSSIAKQMNWIESTEAAAQNMLSMINEMLTLSSIDSVSTILDKQTVDFSCIVEKSILQMESLAYEKDVLLVSELDDNISITSDAEYLQRITTNLIENGIKYEPSKGTVTISLTTNKKSAIFSVQNHNSVINESDLPHVFERFYRSDKARNTQNGHGLGLAIAKDMTEALGGTIDVKSTVKDGTVFSVRFPI